ncbi:MAG: sugar ABC transporter ATP-binding protein, partial [Granulosicoccus sp.]|nr:sugar ABC transporter ATP-binding protein [Granulosicoccus sp.]
MRGIVKSFAGALALDGASLNIASGEVHGLIGQNGAGKSTLIKILTGVYVRDAGEVEFAGNSLRVTSPRDAQAAGISTIYQELTLVPLRSVTENVTLGYEPRTQLGLIDWRRAHDRTREILTGFGIDIDVRAPLGDYSTAIQQLVAIARAVSLEARLVIMDEPTSSLDEREVSVLFSVIRRLKEAGTSVLYVSHFLNELFAVCDRVTVMRDGATVADCAIEATNKTSLIAQMLGRDVSEIKAVGMTELGGGSNSAGERIFDARAIATNRRLRRLDLAVHAGEIVGLGGLLGSGRTEAARAIFGADALSAGTLDFTGLDTPPRTPAAAIASGIGFLTEDRKAEGIVPDMSVRENLTLALLPALTRHGRIDRSRERALVEHFVTSLGIRLSDMDQPIRELSGGNQQKVLLARWLAIHPKLLILDEPTRGVDVGAKFEIQAIIREHVEEGVGVLLISSEFEELVEGADHIVVMQ